MIQIQTATMMPRLYYCILLWICSHYVGVQCWILHTCSLVPMDGCLCTNTVRTDVVCSGLDLEQFNDTILSQLQEVEHLELSYNNLLHLPNDSFSGVVIKSLTISYNIRPLDIDCQAISGTTKSYMEYLTLSHDSIQTVPKTIQNMPNLISLDLSHNLINRLNSDDFEGLLNLTSLNVIGNPVEILGYSTLEPLRGIERLGLTMNRYSRELTFIFELQSNNLYSIKDSLKVLSLYGLALEGVDFLVYFKQLEILELHQCALTSYKLISTARSFCLQSPRMSGVDLSGNFLTEIPTTFISLCYRLKFLNLASNRIIHLNRTLGFRNLEHLDLHDNLIESIADGVFDALVKLRFLDLSDNRLLTLQSTALPIGTNTHVTIHLTNNPFECSCNIVWLAMILGRQAEGHEGPFPVYDVHNLMCSLYRVIQDPIMNIYYESDPLELQQLC